MMDWFKVIDMDNAEKLKRVVDYLGDVLDSDPLTLMNWLGPPIELSQDSLCHRSAVVCDLATFALAEVVRLNGLMCEKES